MARFARSWFINGETGRYCHFQLWNQGTSPLTVQAAGASIPSASMVVLLTADAQLDHSLIDAGASSDQGIDGGNNPSYHGRLRYRVDSTLFPGGQIVNRIGTANSHVPFPECQGLIVPPGRGLFIRTPTLAMSFYGTFVWDE